MKQFFFTKLAIAFGLSIVGLPSSSHTIQGLNRAVDFKSNSSSDFYIQVDSYLQKLNAIRAVASLQKKITQPIQIKEIRKYYVVLIGPMHTAAAVRNVAQKIAPNLVHKAQHLKIENKFSIKANVEKSTLPEVTPYKKEEWASNKWLAGLAISAMFPFKTNATNYASSGMPGFPDDRYVGNDSKAAGQYSVLAGYQWRRNSQCLPTYSLSLQYTYTDSAKIKGVIFVNGLPESKNFNYKYDISQHLPMIKLKADLYRLGQFMPYFTAGVGFAFNRVHNYSDSPIPGATFMQRRYGFSSSTHTELTGLVGVGLDYWLNYKSQLSLGYELAYYGQAKTGNGIGSLSANHLSNDLNSNTLVLQGTYFFDKIV